MRMPIKNNFIGVSADFMMLVPHIVGRVAAAILLPLTQVKHKESWNDNEVGVYKDELFEIMHLSSSYKHSGVFNSLLKELYDKAMAITVDGLCLIESYEIEHDSIYVTYSKGAFDRFFQRLGLEDRRTRKTTRYFTFLSNDIGALTKYYSWDVFKSMILSCKEENTWSTWTINTRDFRKLTGMKEDEYIRLDGGIDRTNLEKKALSPALEEIAALASIQLFCQKETTDKTGIVKSCYFRKEYLKLGNAKRRNPVKYYEVKYKKLSIAVLKSKFNIEEDTENETIFK